MLNSFYDNCSFVSKLSIKKIINYKKLILSFYLSRIFKKSIHWGYPASISIEPTTSCNLECPQCLSGTKGFTRKQGNIDYELYKKIINELKSHLIYHSLYFQGEPLLHPHFFDLVKYTNSNNIYTATSTNGHFFSDSNCEKIINSGLNRIIISIDGTTQETYEKYRIKGKLNKVIEGTKKLVLLKNKIKSKTPFVIVQFLVFKHNQHQITEAKQLAKKIGVNKIIFKTAQIYDCKKSNKLIPTNNKYSRYFIDDKGNYVIKSKLKKNCWRMWHSAVVTWDGIIVPCCFDKDAKYSFGNVSISYFYNIWKNNKYDIFRNKIFKSRNKIDICTNCTEGIRYYK
ncbi:MAG: SPASM domain-containing protein [Bacteroidales bacterium]|nr:SPASM domain-containing protein [Bacteroidales bacterium]